MLSLLISKADIVDKITINFLTLLDNDYTDYDNINDYIIIMRLHSIYNCKITKYKSI